MHTRGSVSFKALTGVSCPGGRCWHRDEVGTSLPPPSYKRGFSAPSFILQFMIKISHWNATRRALCYGGGSTNGIDAVGVEVSPKDVISTYPEKWEGFWGPVYVQTQPYLSTKLGEFVSILAKGINRVLLFPFFPSFISFEFIPMYTGGCVNISRGANLWNLFQCLLEKDLWNNQSSRTSFTHAWTCFLFSE